jgi:hypothetical protein
LEEKTDEIKLLKQGLESANKLLRCQENRLVITSPPIVLKWSETREENDPGLVLEEIDTEFVFSNPAFNNLVDGHTRVRFFIYIPSFISIFSNIVSVTVIGGSRCVTRQYPSRNSGKTTISFYIQ